MIESLLAVSDIPLLPILIPVGVIAFFFVAIIAASLWEKRPIQPYYVPERGTEYEPSAAAKRANIDAKNSGFKYVGICHDGKGKMYKVRYDFWSAPDRCTIAVIGSGTVASLKVNGIWLVSRTEDERYLTTTNERGEQDISGVEEQQTWHAMAMPALLGKHQLRLEKNVPSPFPAESPMSGYFDMRRRKAETLVEKGYAKYVDEDQAAWKYTLSGAIRFYFIATWIRPLKRFLRNFGLFRD